MPVLPNTDASQIILGANPPVSTACIGMEGPRNGSSTTTKFCLVLGTLQILYYLTSSAVQWRFPCQTTEEIDARILKVESLIDSNSYLDNDVLGETFDGFKAWLEGLYDDAHELRIRACREPSRADPLAWCIFRWEFLYDLDACYKGLKELEGRVEETIRMSRIPESNDQLAQVGVEMV
ncbi:hypothetical protein VNI00_013308 [Paramarasmius palmivorus]|uniref:Uncharacterized protein n=1 Tax=Paramarasmius palmivorus TaxID=297713 RepID=A0AAW0C046_9AGAR